MDNELMDMVRFPNRHASAPARFLPVVQRGRDTGCLQLHRGSNGGPGHARRDLAAEEQEEFYTLVGPFVILTRLDDGAYLEFLQHATRVT